MTPFQHTSDLFIPIEELNNKAYLLRHTEPSESLALSEEALEKAIQCNYLKGKSAAFLNIGFCYLNKGDNKRALENFSEALHISKDSQNLDGVAEAKYHLGVLNFRIGNYELALAQISESLKIRKDLNQKENIGKCYYQLAIIRFQLGEYDGTLSAIIKSRKSAKTENSNSALAALASLEGRVYMELKKFPKAEDCIMESLNLRLSLDEKVGLASSIYYMMELWMKQGLLEKAKAEMQTYANIFDDLEFPYGQTQFKLLQARIAMKSKENSLVIKHLNASIEISEKHQLRQQLGEAYELYAKHYEENENYKLALEYFKKFHKINIEISQHQTKKLLENHKLNSDIEIARKKADILFNANLELTNANKLISAMNNDMKSSISYAKRIQDALFNNSNGIGSYFENYLFFHNPKDIVSGDFIWMTEKMGAKYLAIADCTGHGVPGAMLSLYANNLLSTIKFYQNTTPAEILEELRLNFVNDLMMEEESLKDGMDMAMIKLQNYELTFAGAYRPVYIIRKFELIEIKGDRQPVGPYTSMQRFVNHLFKLEPGDQVILFTDGMSDQMGGEKNKKLKVNGLKEWLLEICNKPIEIQRIKLAEKMLEWKGENEQTDDQLIFSFIVH